MTPICYTLVAEGPSDALLMHIIDWLWRGCPQIAAIGRFFDPGKLRLSRGTLEQKITAALQYYPCDILFVHRDADTSTIEAREAEIRRAAAETGQEPIVCVIPVRATEAWLLFDERAIREAAGNPNGSMPLNLPSLGKCDCLADPKMVLLTTLKTACGLSGRRLKHFSTGRARARAAELIADYSPILALPAFKKLQTDMQRAAGHFLQEDQTNIARRECHA